MILASQIEQEQKRNLVRNSSEIRKIWKDKSSPLDHFSDIMRACVSVFISLFIYLSCDLQGRVSQSIPRLYLTGVYFRAGIWAMIPELVSSCALVSPARQTSDGFLSHRQRLLLLSPPATETRYLQSRAQESPLSSPFYHVKSGQTAIYCHRSGCRWFCWRTLWLKGNI